MTEPRPTESDGSATSHEATPEQGKGVPRDPLANYVPRTELGRELMAIRNRIVASGQPLLDWEGVRREVAERRGGVYDPDE